MIKFVRENLDSLQIDKGLHRSYLAAPTDSEKQCVKEVLENLYNDDYEESLLEKYQFLKDFVTMNFEKQIKNEKSF